MSSYRIFIPTIGSLAMTNIKDFNERRKHERFKVKSGAIAMIKTLPIKPKQTMDMSMGENPSVAKHKYCQIINISKGGLAFRYIDKNSELNEPFELDVLFAQDRICLTYLKNVQCKTVWVSHASHAAGKTSSSHLITIQRGVQFGEMTSHQASQLDSFLKRYTIR